MIGLRQLRTERLLTLRDMERETGISQVTICMIEQGKRQPRIKTIRTLSTYFGVEPRQVREFSTAMDGIINGGQSG